MEKFYYNKELSKEENSKESSEEETSTFLKLHRSNIMAEGNQIFLNEEIIRAAARRELSVDNIDQMDRASSNMEAAVESPTKSIDDNKMRNSGSTASTVVITESELSSSWLYKNRKIAMDPKEEDTPSPLPLSQSTNSGSSSELGTVEFQNSGMKPVLIPTTKRPEKASSRCCYLIVVVLICICTVGLFSAIGGILYLEVFSVREQPESATQISTADEMLRSAMKLKNRDAKSNKFIPYESKDVLYSDILTLLNEANARNFDDARHLRDFPIPEDNTAIPQPTDYSEAETSFENVSGRRFEVALQTTTEDSTQLSSTVSQPSRIFPENIFQSSKREGKENEKSQLNSDDKNTKSLEVKEFSKEKELALIETFEGLMETASDSSLRSEPTDILSNSLFGHREVPEELNKQNSISSHNTGDFSHATLPTPLGEKEKVIEELEQKSSEYIQSNEISLHPPILDSSNKIQFEENVGRVLPKIINDTDVSNTLLKSVQNQQPIKSNLAKETKFGQRDFIDIIPSSEATTLDGLDVIESKVTIRSDRRSENSSEASQSNETPKTDSQELNESKTIVPLNKFSVDSSHTTHFNDSSTRYLLDFTESKPDGSSGEDSSGDVSSTDSISSSSVIKAFKEPEEKEAFIHFNETDTFFDSHHFESVTEIQKEQSEVSLTPTSSESKQMHLAQENTEDRTSQGLVPDQNRKKNSDAISKIPSFSGNDNLKSTNDSSFEDFSSGNSDSISVTSILASGTVASKITQTDISLNRSFSENPLSNTLDKNSEGINTTEVEFDLNRPILSASIAPVNFLKQFQQKALTPTTTQHPATPNRPGNLQASLAEVLKYLQPLDTKNKLPVSRTKTTNPNGKKEKLNESRFTTTSVPDFTTERIRYLQMLREMLFERRFG